MVGAVTLVGVAIWALSSVSSSAATNAAPPTGSATSFTALTASAAQINVPTVAATTPTTSSPSATTPSPDSSAAAVTKALADLQRTITAQAASGGLDANAARAMDNGTQHMQQVLAQAEIQASQNPQNQTQIGQNVQHQFNDQIRNMRQQLAGFVQGHEATHAADAAINGALDRLQQSIS